MNFYKYISLFLLLTLISSAHEGVFKGAAYSGISSFHREIHDAEETYLICHYEHKVLPWTKHFKKMELKATIVAVIKSPKKVGEKIVYYRKIEGEAGDTSGINGSLDYAHYRTYDKDSRISLQDPAALTSYSLESRVVADAHRKTPIYDHSQVSVQTLTQLSKELAKITDQKSAQEAHWELVVTLEMLNFISSVVKRQQNPELATSKKAHPQILALTKKIKSQLETKAKWITNIEDEDPEPMPVPPNKMPYTIKLACKTIEQFYKPTSK